MSIDRNKVLEAAQKHLAKGNLDKAIAEFQRLVAADPKDVRTLLKIAELQAKKGSIREAVDTYLKVGDSYASQGFFSKSVAVYKQAVRLDQMRLDALKKLAQNYEELQHTADALAAYDMLAQAYTNQNQTDGALSAMQRATEIDPQNLAARIRYAEALSRAQKTKEAADEFEKGARLIKAQGRMDDYIKVAERLLFHRENDLEVARELAALYLERNDGKRALGKLQMLFKANPKDENVLGMLAQAFVSLDQRDKAVQVLKELAKNHLDARRPEERERALRRILELDPNDVEAKQALSGNAPVARPRVNIDDVVPATAVIGGGGRRAGAQVNRPAGAEGAPAVPMPGANRAPAPSVPRPGLVSNQPSQSNLAPPRPAAQAAPPALPVARRPPSERPATLDDIDIEAEPELDDVIIVDDDLQSLVPEAPPEPARPVMVPQPSPLPSPRPSVAQPAPVEESSRDSVVSRMLAECDVFARYGLRARIVEQLEKVVGLAPDHLKARERLRDAYLEEGRTDDAVDQMLELAELTRTTDPSYAIAVLRQALEHDDENPDVKRALRSLDPGALPARPSAPIADDILLVDDDAGAPVPDPSFEDDAVMFVDESSQPAIATRPAPALDELPDVALEPEPFETIAPRTRPPSSAPAARPVSTAPLARTPSSVPSQLAKSSSVTALPAVLGDFDDADDYPPPSEPVPEYRRPISVAPEPPIVTMSAIAIEPAANIEQALEDFDLEQPMSPEEFDAAPVAAAPVPSRAAAASSTAVEDVLDEVEFYLAQHLFDEARDTLRDALESAPNHPILLDRLADIDDLEAEHAASGAPAETSGASAVADAIASTVAEEDDDAFALAERLAEAMEEELGPTPATSAGADTIDVDQVFAQFKRGIEQQIDESDSETHYDLGIAYKEMGLLEDAVNEFEIASRNTSKASIALTMIGLCRVEQGQVDDGIAALERALAAPHKDAREELGLWFELGLALALAGRNAEAIAYYERVQRQEPTFRGVGDRITQLRGGAAEPEAEDTSDQDELERAFDELITG